MDELKCYEFKKDYVSDEGTVPVGRELRCVRGVVYMDGGMLPPAYQAQFKNLIENKNLRNEYLREKMIIKDKV